MSVKSANWAAELEAALRTARERCNAVLSIAREQAEAVRTGGELEALTARREAAFEALTAAYAGVEPFRDAWDGLLGGLAEDEAERIGSLADELSAAAAEVQRLDEASLETLRERSESLRREMNRVGTSRRAIRGYGPEPTTHIPRYQDRSA